jgi:hypothetical protein
LGSAPVPSAGGPPPPSTVPPAGALVLSAALLLALLILATRLATLLHEAAGHALVAALFGANVKGIAVSLFGGGWTSYAFDDHAGPAPRALAAWGGIAVNVLTGLAALALVRPQNQTSRTTRAPTALFMAIFAGVSLMGAVAYAALGLYYDAGDPVSWMDVPRGGLAWIPWLAAAPVAAWIAMRRYGAVQEVLFASSGEREAPAERAESGSPGGSPSRTGLRRIGIALATLGVAAGAYAGLYAIEGAPFVAADAASMAQRRAEREEMRRRFEEALARARVEHPGMAEEDLRRLVEATLAPLRPGDVPAKFPLVPVLAALFAAGGAAGLWSVKPSAVLPVPFPSPRAVALAAALAALLLVALAWIPWVH